MEKSIMPECYADTLLIETLVPPITGYNHKMGCFKVEAEMRFGKLKDQFAVGIIDNDKRQIKYLEEFDVADKVNESLILWKHNNKNHFIIQICPALEKWVLKVCESGSIDLSEFELDIGLHEFKRYTKSRSGLEDEKLKKLFKVISSKSDLQEIAKLKHWIKMLKNKNYKVDINELRNG